MTIQERREKRLTLVMQWLSENPNVSHYFTVKIPNLPEKIDDAIIVRDSLYGDFIRYASAFLPRQYVVHIVEHKLRLWLCDNGLY